ncbi:MAG: choice-of-anchor tandem repeat GloVer-containing protein [Candidatus Sulfotelmatobacter sp.]
MTSKIARQCVANLATLSFAVPLFCAAIAVTAQAQTPRLTTLYNFCSDISEGYCTDGSSPYAALIQAANGYLYGTTESGGANGYGTVFKINTSGGSATTPLYSFCSQVGCTDGVQPQGGLLLATDGALYGTTFSGGANTGNGGTVFKITPSGTLTSLYSFGPPPYTTGANPTGTLVQATNGDLYGTASGQADSPGGTIFKINQSGTSFGLLYTFCPANNCTTGIDPFSGVIQATNGDFYGTAEEGGPGGSSDGTIFKVAPNGAVSLLYSFCQQTGCADGFNPIGTLVQGSDGNLYGTTYDGGTYDKGTVFKITPSGVFQSLYSFCQQVQNGVCTDGEYPVSGLIQATDGNLYGTTYYGGPNGFFAGTVFKITTAGPPLTTVYAFCQTTNSEGYCADGSSPTGGLLQDTNGTFYGTTFAGGPDNGGTIFSLNTGLTPFVSLTVPSNKEGAAVGILGQGFTGSSVVKFHGVRAASVTREGATYLSATIPAGALTGAVTVSTGATVLTSNRTFRVTPTFGSFSPPSGPVGTLVTISGTGLLQATKVTFNGSSAAPSVISDTEITATVPSGAATGKITVTTQGGSASSATSFVVD